MLPKALGREAMLARVVTQAREIELGDARGINEDIDRQVAIACAREFIDEIAHGMERIALRAISGRIQRRTQFFEQSGIGAFRQRVGDDGVSGYLKATSALHSVLHERMPRQMRQSEARTANTPPAPVFIRAP